MFHHDRVRPRISWRRSGCAQRSCVLPVTPCSSCFASADTYVSAEKIRQGWHQPVPGARSALPDCSRVFFSILVFYQFSLRRAVFSHGDGMEPVFEETVNNNGVKSKKGSNCLPFIGLKKKQTSCLNVKTSPYIPQVISHDLMRQTVYNLVICSICYK